MIAQSLITGSTTIDFPSKIALPHLPTPTMAQYQTGQIWGALRKAWKGYRIAKVQHDNTRMREYATRIKTLQGQLGVPLATFPDLGL
jgi:hypothetical protein